MSERSIEKNETRQQKPARLRRWLIFGTVVVVLVSTLVFGLPIYRAYSLKSDIRQHGGRAMRVSELFPPPSDPDNLKDRVSWIFYQLCYFGGAPEIIVLSNCDLSEVELNRLLVRLHYSDDLTALDLSGTRLTDEGFVHVADLNQIKYLSVSDTRLTDLGMKHIARMEQIIRLDLSATQVTDAGLQYLQKLKNLESLSLDCTNVSDAGLKSLHNLKHLSGLELSNTSVTDEGVTELLQKLPGLNISDD